MKRSQFWEEIKSPAVSEMSERHSNGQGKLTARQTRLEPSGTVQTADMNFRVIRVWRTTEAIGVSETAWEETMCLEKQ